MASLIGQSIAVALAACILIALLRRLGVSLGFARAAAVTVVVVLGALSVGNLRESWHLLDLQRARTSQLTPDHARGACLAQAGVDRRGVGWLGQHIPSRERFYLQSGTPLGGNKSLCIRILLLPRLQVPRPEQARYLVFWQGVPPAELDALRRRGAAIETLGRDYALARLP